MNIRKEPIGHTCPDIDRAIKNLKEILSEILAYERDAHKSETDNILIDRITLDSWSSAISDICEGRTCYLEDLRDSNSTLRQWGNDLVSELEKNDDEIESLQKELDHRENELSLRDDIIYDLRQEIRELNNQ